jgi:hypothetical protein
MPLSLIFHPVEPGRSGESPFVAALRRVAEGGALDLVCPYLSLDVLDAHVLATDWRLLTDVEAWIEADWAYAVAIADFIARHSARVRDCRGLHAKVAIGSERALAGSANFTRMGLEMRHELSVLIEDARLLAELRAWFDALWVAAPTPDPVAVRAYAQAVERATHARQALEGELRGARLGQAGPRVRPAGIPRARGPSSKTGLPLGDADLAPLAAQLRALFPDATAASAALDLLNEAISLSELDADDERLFVNATENESRFRFSVTIGNKYVASFGRRRGHVTAALMVSEETMERADVRAQVVSVHEPFAGEDRLYLARLRWSHPFAPPAGVLEDWRALVRAEARRAGRSPYRTRYGFRPVPFYVVTHHATRREVLRLAFEERMSPSVALRPARRR